MAIDTIKSTAVLDGAIATADIADANITTAKIADDAVTTDKLANAINTDIAAKLPLAGGTMTGTITSTQTTALQLTNETTNKIHFGDSANASIGKIEYVHSSNHLAFKVNDAERMSIDSSGHAIIGGGVTLGNGQTYAAANTLDDYEEGVYQPTLTGSTSGSATMRADYGYLAYTKIGRLVTVTGRWETTGGHNIVGNVIMSLPFAQTGSLSAQAETGVGTMSLNRTGTNFDQTNLFQTVTFPGESQLYIYYQPSGTGNEAIVQGSQLDSAFEGYINHTFIAENQ